MTKEQFYRRYANVKLGRRMQNFDGIEMNLCDIYHTVKKYDEMIREKMRDIKRYEDTQKKIIAAAEKLLPKEK